MVSRKPTDSDMSDDVLMRQFHQLVEDNKNLRRAGCALACAALRVIKTYDGTHRLALAISAWTNAIADEGGRPHGREANEEISAGEICMWLLVAFAMGAAAGYFAS